MENIKKLKRGEMLYKEGDQPSTVYLIQSGKVGLMHERAGKRLEVLTVGASQVLGENGLFSTAKHIYSAEALQETKVLEVPVEIMKAQFEKAPPGIKLLVKSLIEEIRVVLQQLKMSRMETEKSPCPQAIIHRLFTAIHLVARHIGKAHTEPEAHIVVSWASFKLYTTRFFGESPQRMRALFDVLAKLKLADLTFGKNDDGEEELQNITLREVQMYEDFAEFYQYHLFKGTKAEAIFVDPLALKVARAMFEISAGAEVDHKGASKLEYAQVLSECKAKYNLDLKNTHLDILEKKGLFVQRKSYDDGRLTLSFDRTEFGKMTHYWSILHEIDKWNEKGFVDMNEKEEVAAAVAGTCPGCKGKIEEQHKFCPSCGFKMAA